MYDVFVYTKMEPLYPFASSVSFRLSSDGNYLLKDRENDTRYELPMTFTLPEAQLEDSHSEADNGY